MATDGCYDWNDTIEDDGQNGFTLLPEGDYEFTVSGLERGRFSGSAKIPPCNKATLTLSIENGSDVATIKTDLILYKTLEWKLSSFFRCIGQKQHGQKLVMDWDHVIGESGMAHIVVKEYIGQKDGLTHKTNEIKYFMDPIPTAPKADDDPDEDIPF